VESEKGKKEAGILNSKELFATAQVQQQHQHQQQQQLCNNEGHTQRGIWGVTDAVAIYIQIY